MSNLEDAHTRSTGPGVVNASGLASDFANGAFDLSQAANLGVSNPGGTPELVRAVTPLSGWFWCEGDGVDGPEVNVDFLHFNGSGNNHLTVGGGPYSSSDNWRDFTENLDFTIAYRARHDTNATNDQYVSRHNGSISTNGLFIRGNVDTGNYVLTLVSPGGNQSLSPTGFTLDTNWHKIMWTVTSTEIAFYADDPATPVDTVDITGFSTYTPSSSLKFFGFPANSSFSFIGDASHLVLDDSAATTESRRQDIFNFMQP